MIINKEYVDIATLDERFTLSGLWQFREKIGLAKAQLEDIRFEALKKGRQLIAPLPYGVDAPCGGKRTFYERWGDELNRQAFSYIPQRSISDNTKAAGLRIRQLIKGIKIVLESHDSLLFAIRRQDVDEQSLIIQNEMERPINFSNCSIPRRDLIIPCEIEIGENYQDMKKFKIDRTPTELIPIKKSRNEEFEVIQLHKDSQLTNIIYNSQMRNE